MMRCMRFTWDGLFPSETAGVAAIRLKEANRNRDTAKGAVSLFLYGCFR